MKEVWKDITGYEGLYQVSNLGRIKSVEKWCNGVHFKEKIKKNVQINTGYYDVLLYKNAKSKHFKIHRLVAQAFIPNPDNLPCVNHKDENKLNNNVNNLEWCTKLYNNIYGTKIEKQKIKLGKKVIQYDLRMNKIAEYNCITDASKKTNNSEKYIRNCCYNRIKVYKNFIWKFKEG